MDRIDAEIFVDFIRLTAYSTSNVLAKCPVGEDPAKWRMPFLAQIDPKLGVRVSDSSNDGTRGKGGKGKSTNKSGQCSARTYHLHYCHFPTCMYVGQSWLGVYALTRHEVL